MTLPAAAQTVTLSASGNCGGTPADCGTNGDRDTSWPGLQVDEGDVVTLSLLLSQNIGTGKILSVIHTPSGSAWNSNDLSFVSGTSLGRSSLYGSTTTSPIGLTMYRAISDGDDTESDETFTVGLSIGESNTSSFTVGTPSSVTVTIRGTDSAPAFGTVSDPTFYKGVYTEFQLPVSGGNGPITYTATLPAGLTFDADGSGACPGTEAPEICGRLSSTQTVTITASDADSNTASNDQASLTLTINTARHPADITDSNGLDETDALLLFQQAQGVRLTDDQATRTDSWQRETGLALGGDINGDKRINEQDALIMVFAYEFEDVLDNSPDLRRLFLNGVRGPMPDTDATYRELLRRALRLRIITPSP